MRSSKQYSEKVEVSNDVEVPRFDQSSQQNVQQTTQFTQSEVKVPLIQPPAPELVLPPAQGLIGNAKAESSARIISTSQEGFIGDACFSEESRQDEKLKQQELAQLAARNQLMAEKKTGRYLVEAEAEAEEIRRQLEKQHQKDIEFRKSLVDQAINTQKKQIDVEEKFAKKELDREAEMALNALEQSKLKTVAEVKLDTAAGTAVSSGTIVSEKVKETTSIEKPEAEKSIGEKLIGWLMG